MPVNAIKFEVPEGAVGLIYDRDADEVFFVPLTHGVQLYDSSTGYALQSYFCSVGASTFDQILHPNGRVYKCSIGHPSITLMRWIDAQRAAE